MYLKVVGTLLKAGADPNFCVNGDPPLKYAASRGNLQMVQLLLDSPDVMVDRSVCSEEWMHLAFIHACSCMRADSLLLVLS